MEIRGILQGMYREKASRVPGAVLWWRIPPVPHGVQRVLPDGCTDVIWADGELLVAGPDTRAHLTRDRVDCFVGLRFAPGTGPAVFGVPAHELRDRRIPLADLWPSGEVRRLADRLNADQPSRLGQGVSASLGVALEEMSLRRLSLSDGPDPMSAWIVARVRAGAPVAEIAGGAGLSERQLHRRCLSAFGYGPRTLGRILRMNRALDMARAGTAFAAVAATAGYADQAHLAREVRSLAGAPLTVLVR
ncbi:AraC family transcriptional regulator [Sphaerimonospora thailandensis]|uniref:AraC family transcriptional regulator n=2 Tax=Sphaerimonospora thailandensis TaxID=795644 RepID=A0A8J3W1L8_9ACTN|nr:AraC family transcriptional regulator [Sphaerimonospora thailandensis]